MAGHLKIKYMPFASPGDVEYNTISGINAGSGMVSATLVHWQEAAKKAKESYGNFAEAETEAGLIGNTSATKLLLNVEQVQNVMEY